MAFQGDSIYWVEVEKIVPNPFQPRREFDEQKLRELADSVRMYGILQPLTVTRNEIQRDDGTFYTEYELVAGERRLRASKLAGLSQVPVIIREGENNEQEKLELAIIENLQREDLNSVDRALAFKQLAEVFGLSHTQVAHKVGRSREYVSNSIRLLGLPETMLNALRRAEMTEGHGRTLLMLNDRPEEQDVVFREILLKKLSVREVEKIVRKIATDKVRKKIPGEFDTQLIEMEKRFMETLGTRVQIQKTDYGGQLTIDYFSVDDLEGMLMRMKIDESNALIDKQNQFASLMSHTPLTTMKEDETVSSAVDESKMILEDIIAEETVMPAVSVDRPLDTPIVPVETHTKPVELPKAIPAPESVDLIAPVRREQIANHLPEGYLNARAVPNHFTSSYHQPAPAPFSNPTPQPATPTPNPAPDIPSSQTEPTALATPAPVKPAVKIDDDSDLYSIRNFSV